MSRTKTTKKCPSCKYDGCWQKAPMCEKCGFDFSLGRKPRKKRVEILLFEDDGDFVAPAPPPPPKVLYKTCPECAEKCWHEAILCQRCEYDFINPKPKEKGKKEEAKKFYFYPKIEFFPIPEALTVVTGQFSVPRWIHNCIDAFRDAYGLDICPEGIYRYAKDNPNPIIKKHANEIKEEVGAFRGERTFLLTVMGDFLLRHQSDLPEAQAFFWKIVEENRAVVERIKAVREERKIRKKTGVATK